MAFLLATGATLLTFLVVDAVWIGAVARNLYAREVGELIRESPRLGAAAVFYLFYAAGLVYLVVQPGVAAGAIGETLARAAALGALAYGTFTVTNYALLNRWTMTLVLSDIAWGAFVTACAAAAGFYVARAMA